jgi:ABC-type nitrate/sulfonate/bicarbonate transport system substrate-binding protein
VVSVAVDWSPVVVAQELGFFKKLNLPLTLTTDTGTNTTNLVASGEYDIAAYTAPIAVSLSEAGKPTSVIANVENLPGVSLVSSSAITSVSDLKSAPNCRIASSAQGTALWYYGLVYLHKLGLQNCTLVPAEDTAVQIDGVVSGEYQAAVLSQASTLTVKSQGGHLLEDATSPSWAKTFARTTIPSGADIGLTADLRSKRASVVAFMQGLMGGADYVNTHSDADVAAADQRDSNYATEPASALTVSLPYVRKFFGIAAKSTTATPMFISATGWKEGLKVYSQYGLTGFSATAPAAQYGKAVDMSYYDAAFPHLVVTDAKYDTLAKVAAWKLGSASDWRTLYTPSKFWLATLNVPPTRIKSARLAPGTVLWW